VLNSEGKLLEIQKSGDLCSWFLNDKSIEDGGVFLTSEIDPIFMMLPILDKARKAKVGTPGVFLSPISLFEEVDTSVSRYLKPFVPSLDAVCDVRSQGNDKYYRLNDDRVVLWLQHKLDGLCEVLNSSPDFASSLVRAHASNFRSRNTQPLTTTELLKLGVGFLGEYLEKKWVTVLESKIGVSNADLLAAAASSAPVAKKAYASEEDVAPRKRSAPSGGHDDDLLKETTTPAKKKLNAAQARLAKVDKTGMSPITSFFKPQAKKS
jgi:ribonuclease H2 subunit B